MIVSDLLSTPSVAGTYEVGVHIADVSYFVNPNNALDTEALQRATSVYLVQKVTRCLGRCCDVVDSRGWV